MLWCAKEDSNLHDLAATTPSKWRVYQFHHSRAPLVNGPRIPVGGRLGKANNLRYTAVVSHFGRLAQLVRAARLHRVGQGFESLSVHQRGPLAQLVERFHGMEEVSGSSPLRSTTKNPLRRIFCYTQSNYDSPHFNRYSHCRCRLFYGH